MPEPAAQSAIRLTTPLSELPGVRPLHARRLAKLDLHYVADLLRHYPRRYEWRHGETPIAQLAFRRVVVSLLEQDMREPLRVSGKKWELQQRAVALRAAQVAREGRGRGI